MKHKPYFYELKEYILGNGKEGSTKLERYIDLPSGIKVNPLWTLNQICYFMDDDSLLVFALNKDDEGKFYEFSRLAKSIKSELINVIENTF
jgi:hypothetical protein